jgi:4-hydroxybenzoyl-CoA thioesterase
MAYLVSRMPLIIEWGHCDPAGIVFNSRFFELFDLGTWVLFEKGLGIPRAKVFSTFDIIGYPIVDARATFHRPVQFGDAVELASTVREFRRSSFDVEHRLSHNGELAVEGMETRVWAGRGADDPAKLKSKPIPQEVIDRLTVGSGA